MMMCVSGCPMMHCKLFVLLLLCSLPTGDAGNIRKTHKQHVKHHAEDEPIPIFPSDIRKAQDPIIAFSAVLKETLNYLPGNTVIFDHTLTNEGGLYFSNTGQFVCNDSDVYIFVWTMSASGNDSIPGMRVITALHRSTDQVKFGPKVSRTDGHYRGVSSTMAAVVECSTSPPSAINVVIQPMVRDQPCSNIVPKLSKLFWF